jgi:3-phosphoglycerate kinase
MKYIIDRIENKIVICENQETKEMEKFKIDQFPEDIKDGDVVILENEKFKIDKEESKTKKQQIEELMKKLMKG